MSKISKTIALLLVIAAVVFVAGCANKTTSNVTQGASEQATPQTPVSSEGVNQSEVEANVPANTNLTENNVTTVDETSENVTENNTSAIVSSSTTANTGQSTETQTATNGTHLNSVQRHNAVAQAQQQSNGTVNLQK
jgi:inhibitor of cysteine peptidase